MTAHLSGWCLGGALLGTIVGFAIVIGFAIGFAIVIGFAIGFAIVIGFAIIVGFAIGFAIVIGFAIIVGFAIVLMRSVVVGRAVVVARIFFVAVASAQHRVADLADLVLLVVLPVTLVFGALSIGRIFMFSALFIGGIFVLGAFFIGGIFVLGAFFIGGIFVLGRGAEFVRRFSFVVGRGVASGVGLLWFGAISGFAIVVLLTARNAFLSHLLFLRFRQ